MSSSSHLFGLSCIVVSLMLSVTVITYTGKFLSRNETNKKSNAKNHIYHPDHGRTISFVCILSEDIYKTMYENSPCYNTTMVELYNPWLHHHFWQEFRARVAEKQIKEIILEEPEIKVENETIEPTEAPKTAKPETKKPKEEASMYIYTILIFLSLLSAMAGIWEVVWEKLRGGANEKASKAAERQCTLADFTINRHLRRESKQASHLPRQASLEVKVKVTQTLIHQSSLDRAFPKLESKVITEERRNSFPSSLNLLQNDKINKSLPGTNAIFGTKRQSVGIIGEDLNVESKKKLRHFIRRH